MQVVNVITHICRKIRPQQHKQRPAIRIPRMQGQHALNCHIIKPNIAISSRISLNHSRNWESIAIEMVIHLVPHLFKHIVRLRAENMFEYDYVHPLYKRGPHLVQVHICPDVPIERMAGWTIRTEKIIGNRKNGIFGPDRLIFVSKVLKQSQRIQKTCADIIPVGTNALNNVRRKRGHAELNPSTRQI